MANIIDISGDSKEAVKTAQAISAQVGITFKKAFWLCILFCGIAVILFFWGNWETLSIKMPIENGLFGTFGDFVGGFLGTIISLYSVYMLVRTFQNQIETNADMLLTNKSTVEANISAIETNRKLVNQTALQIFDSRFSTLLNLYHDAINSYSYNGSNGRVAFEMIVSEFQKRGLDNNTEYKRRSIGATSEYVNLYVNNRQSFSVHFRMLYLLSKMTAEEKMFENYRASYAKSIRGQLSEGELLVLRYNCLSPYGEKMRTYVNKFNLIKHLPVMNLLEFTVWRKMIADDACCSSIDQLYITLKKKMTGMLDRGSASSNSHIISSRLRFDILLNDKCDTFDISFSMLKAKKRGGAIKRPLEENAFDKIEQGELKSFLREFFIEMFVYSNFFLFNGVDLNFISTHILEDSEKTIKIQILVSRPGKQLALADRQVLPS